MGIQIVDYGGQGGTPFDMQAVHSVGVHWGGHIDALQLNGETHGGPGADHMDPEFPLEADEYINGFILRHGDILTALRFFTNQGKEIGVSHARGNPEQIVGNIRVLGLGGRSGSNLDRITIKYIDNYTPSALVEESVAIINVFAPGAAIERFTSTQVQTLVSHTHVMESVWNVDGKIESGSALEKSLSEFIAKVTVSGGYKSTTRDEIKNQTTTTTLNSEKTTFTTPTGTVGLEMAPAEVFVDTQSSPNFVWLFLTGPSTIVTVDQKATTLSTSAYDLTRFLGTQIPSLLPKRQQRNGYNFYPMG